MKIGNPFRESYIFVSLFLVGFGLEEKIIIQFPLLDLVLRAIPLKLDEISFLKDQSTQVNCSILHNTYAEDHCRKLYFTQQAGREKNPPILPPNYGNFHSLCSQLTSIDSISLFPFNSKLKKITNTKSFH